MKADKKINKQKTGSVRIEPSVLIDAKVVCAKNSLLIQDYVTEAVRVANSKNKK